MEPIRLQKFLAQQGFGSRRNAEQLISDKKVIINGTVAQLGDKVQGNERIFVEGKKVKPIKHKKKIVAFYKPVGVECTMKSSAETETLADFDFGFFPVFPVGRLDKDSQGLLLMTNDGDLANKLMHPRYHHEKEYVVSVNKEVTTQQIEQLGNGSLKIDGKKVNPAQIKPISPTVFSIILTEGRNRQIRRMCQAVGLKVIDLLRIRIEKTHLGSLKPGKKRSVDIRFFTDNK
ncbi:23S rRNA pseudouridine synthase F [bacterium DOLZORAL124_38_8]|nr:MAG: 23S rRNA pseudouridine synthase F [bacterium DOLZORAL124_38_8]